LGASKIDFKYGNEGLAILIWVGIAAAVLLPAAVWHDRNSAAFDHALDQYVARHGGVALAVIIALAVFAICVLMLVYPLIAVTLTTHKGCAVFFDDYAEIRAGRLYTIRYQDITKLRGHPVTVPRIGKTGFVFMVRSSGFSLKLRSGGRRRIPFGLERLLLEKPSGVEKVYDELWQRTPGSAIK
jgi:hypothetical protein